MRNTTESLPQEAREQHEAPVTKHQMIDAIRERNRSATPDFLAGFDERTLKTYLQRLTHLANRRGRDSVWVREGTTGASDPADAE